MHTPHTVPTQHVFVCCAFRVGADNKQEKRRGRARSCHTSTPQLHLRGISHTVRLAHSALSSRRRHCLAAGVLCLGHLRARRGVSHYGESFSAGGSAHRKDRETKKTVRTTSHQAVHNYLLRPQICEIPRYTSSLFQVEIGISS